MALEPRDLLTGPETQTPALRAAPYENGIFPGTLSAISGAPELPHLTPLGFSGGEWSPWGATANQETVIVANATPATDGTFKIVINGTPTADIDHDAAAAAIEDAIEALASFNPGDVAVVDFDGGLGASSGGVVITFQGQYAGTPVTVALDLDLTGNAHAAVLVTTAASSAIRGFLWIPEPAGHQSHATNETLIQVLRRGTLHADDVPVPTGEDAGDLLLALADPGIRDAGIDVRGVEVG